MLRNSTHKYKKMYQKNTIRQSTPLKRNIYTDTFRHTKAALKTQTSLNAIRMNQSRTLPFQISPHASTKQQRLHFTEKITSQQHGGVNLDREVDQSEPAVQLQKIDNQSTNKTITDLKWTPAKGSSLIQRQPRVFIQNLSKNALFYCCKCYQYVFEVQKKRHFPNCKDQLYFANFQKQQILQMCWQRLQRIKELSSYSKTREREIHDLMQQVRSHEFHRILLINYPKDSSFFTLSQIEQAFVYTYENLLKGRIYRHQRDFFNFCK